MQSVVLLALHPPFFEKKMELGESPARSWLRRELSNLELISRVLLGFWCSDWREFPWELSKSSWDLRELWHRLEFCCLFRQREIAWIFCQNSSSFGIYLSFVCDHKKLIKLNTNQNYIVLRQIEVFTNDGILLFQLLVAFSNFYIYYYLFFLYLYDFSVSGHNQCRFKMSKNQFFLWKLKTSLSDSEQLRFLRFSCEERKLYNSNNTY